VAFRLKYRSGGSAVSAPRPHATSSARRPAIRPPTAGSPAACPPLRSGTSRAALQEGGVCPPGRASWRCHPPD
jgi:hypothetical protein